MSEWLQCLNGTKVLPERNPNAPEMLLRTEDRYGSTVTVRMNSDHAAELAAQLKEMSEE